jgi:parvulin-like peptidyl-prolyl isomerase
VKKSRNEPGDHRVPRRRLPKVGDAARIALLVGALGVAVACGGTADEEAASGAVFRLGERVVEADELRRFLLREVGLPREDIDEKALPAYRRQLAAQVLFARAARKLGLEPHPAALQAEKQLLRELAPETEAQIVEREARRAVLARLYENEILAQRVSVTPEEVETRLGAQPREGRTAAVFRQIVVEEADRAREVHRRLARGEEPFEAVAREVSSGPEQGALQQVPLNHLPDSVQRTLRRTPEGTVSRPVEIEGLYYLFEVQALNRDPDPARRREREEVRRRLFREKLDQLRTAHLKELAQSEGIKLPPQG